MELTSLKFCLRFVPDLTRQSGSGKPEFMTLASALRAQAEQALP